MRDRHAPMMIRSWPFRPLNYPMAAPGSLGLYRYSGLHRRHGSRLGVRPRGDADRMMDQKNRTGGRETRETGASNRLLLHYPFRFHIQQRGAAQRKLYFSRRSVCCACQNKRRRYKPYAFRSGPKRRRQQVQQGVALVVSGRSMRPRYRLL